jgi:hypothetical protein
MSDSKNRHQGSRLQGFSRRKFLLGSAATAAGAALTAAPERADAFFNLLGFMKKSAGNGQTSNGYVIGQSLMTKGNGWLSRSLGATYTDQSRSSHSFWMKRAALSLGRETDVGVGYLCLGPGSYLSGDAFWIGSNNASPYTYTTAAFRDPSAWYHILVTYDYNATSGNRVKLYINGTQYTNWYSYGEGYSMGTFGGTGGSPWGSGGIEVIGSAPNAPSNTNYMFDGYLAEIHAIDGQVLSPTAFGEIDTRTGQWIPKKYAGTYGTQGHYLNFSDSANLGQDMSGNGNHFVANTYTSANQCIDSPTNNFCTLNPLYKRSVGFSWSAPVLASGNISTTSACLAVGNMALPAGQKTYFEVKFVTVSGNATVGVIADDALWASATTTSAFIFYTAGGTSSLEGGLPGESPNVIQTGLQQIFTNDVLGVAVDLSANTMQFYYNGSTVGPSISLPSGKTWYPVTTPTSSGASALNFSFGQGGQPGLTYYSAAGGHFAYTPPTGFKALCTANLSAPAIKNSTQYFDTVLYTGNGGSQTVGTNFAPDFLWIKNRTVGSSNHLLEDSTRLFASSKILWMDKTYYEGQYPDYGAITAVSSSSFTVIGGPTSYINTNASTNNYVAWYWKKGSAPGFDIQTYTGNGTASLTVNHSLGANPAIIIIKRRDSSGNGWVTHQSQPGGISSGYMYMNTTAAFTALNWITIGTSSFNVSTSNADVNASGGTYVAYLWSEIAGFSKFGSYTGNGSSDGPFVYCGFKPRWVMLKRTDSAGYDWEIIDTARDPYNVTNNLLLADNPQQEVQATSYSFNAIDILSNGFKHRGTNGSFNTSSGTYIFVAFAEAPFKYATAR